MQGPDFFVPIRLLLPVITKIARCSPTEYRARQWGEYQERL